MLKSVAYAWQQQSLTDDAKMLFDLSRELYERFAVLGERATKLGSAITKTVGAYNSFAASLESRVLVTARKLQRVDQSKVIGTVDMIGARKRGYPRVVRSRDQRRMTMFIAHKSPIPHGE